MRLWIAATSSWITAAPLHSWLHALWILREQVLKDKEVWERPKEDGYVIVTRDADFQELSLVWGQPPKVIRLKTLNQSRAATLKILIDNKDAIIESLETHDLASVEIVS